MNQITLHFFDSNDFVTFELLVFFVYGRTQIADELGALSAKAGSFTSRFGAFFTGQFLRLFNLLECFLDVKKMVYMEGSLEATHTSGG